jgi:S-formylglutathione hydrolase
VPWGKKAFTNYLGPDQGKWDDYDATVLIAKVKDANRKSPILIDQGLADQFLEQQLQPHLLEEVAREVGLCADFETAAGVTTTGTTSFQFY